MIRNFNSFHHIQLCGRGLKRLIVGAAVALTLAACGGGGGGGSGDGDLRAAYDRINRACMTYSDIDQAVGSPANEMPSAGRRRWTAGNQDLTVIFAQLRSGTYVASSTTWNIVPGGELEKGFEIECGGI